MDARRALSVAVACLFLVARPGHVSAQLWFVDVDAQQSFTSLDPLSSPWGFEASVGGLRVAGPLGLQVSYRRAYERGDRMASHCDVSTCAPGPFDPTYSMSTFGIGLNYDFVNPTGVFLTLALTGGTNWQTERLKQVSTGQRSTGYSVESDSSMGASAHLRLRPMFIGMRPSFAARFDRVWGGGCLQDTACVPNRNVYSISIGLAWIVGDPSVSP